jgi:hypothetical protein
MMLILLDSSSKLLLESVSHVAQHLLDLLDLIE